MKTKLLYLSIFVVFSLACGMQAPKVNPTQTAIDTRMTPEMSVAVKMTVTGSLNIRADHTEKSDDIGDLFRGQTVTCFEFYKGWCKHELGWSNTHWLRMVEEKAGK